MTSVIRTTKLRLKILEAKLPQYEIARRVGIPSPRISEYSLGKRIPMHHVLALCEFLHCKPSEIIE